MSDVWTPNRGDKRGGLTIYVPGRHADNPALDFVCRIPTKTGGPCGHRADSLEALTRHLKSCTSRNEQAIHDGTLKERVPIMHRSQWDEEYEEWMLGIGRKMIAEGRFHQHRNER